MVKQDMSPNFKLSPFLEIKKSMKGRTDVYRTYKPTLYSFNHVSVYCTLQCGRTPRHAISLDPSLSLFWQSMWEGLWFICISTAFNMPFFTLVPLVLLPITTFFCYSLFWGYHHLTWLLHCLHVALREYSCHECFLPRVVSVSICLVTLYSKSSKCATLACIVVKCRELLNRSLNCLIDWGNLQLGSPLFSEWTAPRPIWDLCSQVTLVTALSQCDSAEQSALQDSSVLTAPSCYDPGGYVTCTPQKHMWTDPLVWWTRFPNSLIIHGSRLHRITTLQE
jgi:hypothetical protein